jgi:hypothetical protein
MIQRILHRNPSKQAAADRPRLEIFQRWVETADERCPLACVWFALPEILADQPTADQDDDEPASMQPAFAIAPMKAGCLHSIHILPAPSIELAPYLKNSMQALAALLLLSISFVSHAQDVDPIGAPPADPAQSISSDDSMITMFPH